MHWTVLWVGDSEINHIYKKYSALLNLLNFAILLQISLGAKIDQNF